MRRFPRGRSILIAFLTCLAVPISSEADHKLLSLVSPGAQVVARISAPSSPNSEQFRHYDANDFYALSGPIVPL